MARRQTSRTSNRFAEDIAERFNTRRAVMQNAGSTAFQEFLARKIRVRGRYDVRRSLAPKK